VKVFIAVDMEGIAGLVKWDPADRERERVFMTEEANAAIRGAFDGGATDMLVGESHANMRNTIPELLDPRAEFLSGEPKPMNHMGGVDGSFDLALFVGYHAKAGTLHANMAHTFNLHVFSLSFNGTEIGEIGADAGLCGHHGVPVGLVTGDAAACEEARTLLGDVETVCVKEAVSHTAARCVPVTRAREMVAEGAAAAVAHADEFKPLTFEVPVAVRLVFIQPGYADAVEHLDFVDRVDGRTIAFEGSDCLQAFERFNALHFLAPVFR